MNMTRLFQSRTTATPLGRVLTSSGLSKMLTAASYSTGNTAAGGSTVATLQRQPVPKLPDTMLKLLKSIEPHVDAQVLAASKRATEQFSASGAVGQKLQELLNQRAAKMESWLAEWWLRSAYMEYRDPVIVYSSPGLVFPRADYRTFDGQLAYAARMASAALAYKAQIDGGKIRQEMMGKVPLDMSQYEKIFGTCRIPGRDRDSVQYNPRSRHIVVACGNRYYRLDVINASGVIVSEGQILAQLQRIAKESASSSSPPVGILTANHRDSWAEAYEKLVADPTNRNSVTAIQQALFVLSIDREIPQAPGSDHIIAASDLLIHGGGSTVNGGNRWYDKTIQLVVAPNGINGLTYEHSPAEGQPIAVMTDFLLEHLKRGTSTADQQTVPGAGEAVELPFNISAPSVKAAIEQAANFVDKLAADIQMHYLHFTDYGKGFIKSQRMSPDSYIQMAIQYAFYRLHKVPGAHYESAQNRMYLHGRTETIRSCSVESIAFARTMLDPKKDGRAKVESMKAAIEAHKAYVSMAIQGYGVDRHLLGLKLTAKEHGIAVPELYSDPGLQASANMRLSTSQVASRYDAFMCYGPLTADGYGCCYNPKEEDMWFGLSAFRSNPNSDVERFRVSLQEALREMYEVLVLHGEKPKGKL
ncbi:carnitine O-acetyltransferase-like [Anopheles darlingi]|uniref:carnitine O-acetyltransferase-like n=1 Tax=Anopheles darlingi TaxID=43151 RepID=UPI0021004BF5|nr:carnitine O-acetyltransferase-like [Anopheles darlingi]XP_049547858.1 carnitine O-acetyltransferase-like [Anopheles darlingi]XP_049547860.1 carnitine O-acetyltransferase-like [Anopheles darlingi]